MNRSLVRVAAAVLILTAGFMSAPAVAAPALIYQEGVLVGIKGLLVSGVEYQVTFADGSCVSLLDGCDSDADFPFASPEEAELASSVLQAVFAERGYPVFGCDPNWACSLLTPINLSDDLARARSVDLYVSGASCTENCASYEGWESLQITSDTANHDDMVYVLWEAEEEVESSNLLLKIVPILREPSN